MRSVPTVGLAFVLGLCLACACEAAADLSREMDRLQGLRDSVDVQADRIEYGESERKVMASGGVRVVLGTRYLYADEVSVDLDDQMLLASGHVILTEGLNQLEGDRIEYNYRTNMGVITNGRGTVEPGLSFSGVEIRKEGERQYALKEGRFTGCRACQPEPQRPDWEFRASEATIYQDEWIAARNASLWVKGIPSLFTPLLTLPSVPAGRGSSSQASAMGTATASRSSSPTFGRSRVHRTSRSTRPTGPSGGLISMGSTGIFSMNTRKAN